MFPRLVRRARIGVALPICTTVAVLVGASGSVAAASMKVPCSAGGAGLVAAVAAANAAGGGTINLASDCTYSLTVANNATDGGNGLPVVVASITVNGDESTIAGNSRFRIFEVLGAEGGALTLNGITITGGHAQGPGGGLFNNEGTVTLNQVLVIGNVGGAGGGIATGTIGTGPVGVMTLNDSEVSGNTVPVSANGGGGGGILNHAGTLTLNKSVVDHNSAPGGGGIASGTGTGNTEGGSLVTLNKSEIRDNTAIGGPFAGGGGIANGGDLVSNKSEITGNSAPGSNGGGLLNHASATLNKTEVSGNSALDDAAGNTGIGGGIANFNLGISGAPAPTLVMNHSEVTENSVSADGLGGGIANPDFFGPGFVTLNHTDVDENSPDNCFPAGSISGCTG